MRSCKNKSMTTLLLALIVCITPAFAQVTIQSAQYSSASTQAVVVTYSGGDVLSVPVDSGNRHYVKLQEWVALGNTIATAPTEAPATVKEKVRMRMENLHLRIIALERERGKVTGQTAKVNLINAKILSIDEEIDSLRPLAY